MKIVGPDSLFSFVDVTPGVGGLPMTRAHARGLTGVLRHGGPLLFRFLPKQRFRKERENFLSGPSRKAGLGAWKPDPLAQAPLWVPRVIGRSPTERHHADELN